MMVSLPASAAPLVNKTGGVAAAGGAMVNGVKMSAATVMLLCLFERQLPH